VRDQRRLVLQLPGDKAATTPERVRHRAFPDAWTRYGLHDDGFVCSLRAAAALSCVASPFAIADADAESEEPRARGCDDPVV
jgi:hypothetical protein